jgi:hypothetical protein
VVLGVMPGLLGSLVGEPIVPVLVPGWFGPGVIDGSLPFDGRFELGVAFWSGVGGLVDVIGGLLVGVVLALLASWLQAVAPAATTSENKSDL